MKTTFRLTSAAFGVAILNHFTATLPAEDYTYATNNGTITIARYDGFGGTVIIPSAISGLPVTSIGPGAFDWCISLRSVTIPNGITNIGNSAFRHCLNLTSVTIPNSVLGIADYAFAGCTNFATATIPTSVTNLGAWVFYLCASLTGVYFQGNAPSVGSDIFVGADKATVFYLPGTTGWGTTFGGRPLMPWVFSNPLILSSSSSFGLEAGHFGFMISWASNMSVAVETSTSLVNPIWLPICTNILTKGFCHFVDPEWTNHPSRFYRLRSP
jgi:hypothetical protein